MGLRSKSKTRLIILTAVCVGTGSLLGGAYVYRKVDRARTIAAGKPKGIEAYNNGEWVEALNHLQNYLTEHDGDIEAQEYFVKVQAKLPEPLQGDQKKEMNAYRRIVALKPADMDAKRALLKLYLALQMNTELLSGADDIIKSVVGQFTTVGAAPAVAAVSTGTAPATVGAPATANPLMDAVNRAIVAINAKMKGADEAKREALNKTCVEPLADALELRALSTANLRRFPEALLAADALMALKGDAGAVSVKLNAMRANGDSQQEVLQELERLSGWKKGDATGKLTDEPMAALMAGNYLYYNDTDTAVILANKAVSLGTPTETACLKLADLLDRMERPEMFVKAREVIEQGREKFKTEPLDDEHYRRLLFQREYEKAADEIAKVDVSKRPVPLAMHIIALCEWSKDLAAAGNKGEADKKKAEAQAILKDLDLCGKRWDTLAIGWHDVLSLVYFSDGTHDRDVVETCEKAITCDPGNAFLFVYQGDAYQATGDLDAALQHWKAAAVRAPAWDRPLALAARLFVDSGEPEQTLKLARQANDRLPNQKDTLVAIVISWKQAVGRMNPADKNRKDQATKLRDFIRSEEKILGKDENALAVEVVVTAEVDGAAKAEDRVKEIVAATTRDNAATLLTLASVTNDPRAGLNESLPDLCLKKYEEIRGMTPDLAWAQAQLRWDQSVRAMEKMDDPDKVKVLTAKKAAADKGIADIKIAYAASRKSVGPVIPAEVERWDIDWCKLLEYFNDPKAHDEWKSAISLHQKSSTALWAALGAQSVHADHLLSGQVLEQLKVLNGDSGLKWRLAKGEWLLDDTASRESLDQAAKLLALTVAASPESVEAYKLRSRGFELSGNLNNAINDLTRAAEMAPEDLNTKMDLAKLYLRQKDTARAVDQLTRVLGALPPPGAKQTPAEIDFRTRAGVMLADAGDGLQALQILDSVQDSRDVEQIKAALYWKLGRLVEATKEYQMLMKDNPTAGMIEQALPFFASLGLEKDGADALAKLEQAEATEPQKHAIKGTYLASTQKWDEAIKELDAAVKMEPKNGNYWRRFIATLIVSGKTNDGVKAAADSGAALPGDQGCAAIAKMTVDQLKEQDTQNYVVAAVLSPVQAKGIDEVVKILQMTGIAPPTIARKLRSVADRNTESVALQVLAVRKLMDANLLDEATVVAQRAMLNDPDSAEPALLATKCLAQEERWDEALTAATKWRTLANGASQADMVIASCYVNLNRAGDAVRLMQPYMSTIDVNDPKYHDLVMLYATALVYSGDAAGAEKMVWPLVVKDASWREDWTKLATGPDVKKRPRNPMDISTATKWLEKLSVEIKPEDVNGQSILAMAWFRLGSNYSSKDGVTKAESIAKEILGPPNEDPSARGDASARGIAAMLFANLRDQQGDAEKAEDYYRMALRLNPKLFYAANNLAMVLSKDKDRVKDQKVLAEAEQYAREALAGAPANADGLKLPFYDTLATVLRCEGKFDEALNTIGMARKQDPENPLWILTEVEIQLDSGRADLAREDLKLFNGLNVDTKNWPTDMVKRYNKAMDGAKMKI